MTVHAPFRFAPIHRWVYFPEWGDLVTHVVPFKDGLSGEIAIEIEVKTPLLVGGGARRKADKDREGEVWPFQLSDGRYAIPGSSLQGTVRSILEVATLGKLGSWIDEKRFGIRDLTDGAKPFYRDRLIGKVRAGFLSKVANQWTIRLCEPELRRVRFNDIPPKKGANPRWEHRSNAVERYSWIRSTGPYRASGPSTATRLEDGDGGAWLVITGNTGAGGPTAKKSEFVFVEDTQAEPLPVSPRVIKDLEFIHQNNSQDDRDRWNPSYREFVQKGYPMRGTRQPLDKGGTIPVFFLSDDAGDVVSIGLAFMFKLAHGGTTSDLLNNSTPVHTEDSALSKMDLASLIFGTVADHNKSTGLKRRASFDVAVCDLASRASSQQSNKTILLGPKPNYYPIYVRQPVDNKASGVLPGGAPYATYTPLGKGAASRLMDEHQEPDLSGVKIWPVRASNGACAFPNLLPPPSGAGLQVQVRLQALPTKTKFGTTLRFHNLRRLELGSILWALSFGDRATLRGEWGRLQHRIGMTKPHGMGQIAVRIVKTTIECTEPSGEVPVLVDLVEEFERTMDAEYRKQSAGRNGSKASRSRRWSKRPTLPRMLKRTCRT